MTNIHILGAGAMGCLWATYFQQDVANKQTNVHFIVRNKDQWPSSPTELQRQPDSLSLPIHVTDSSTANGINKLIVATKAQHALAAIKSVEHGLSPDCEVLLLQNGMGSQQAVAEAFPNLTVYACSSTEGAYKTNVQTVVHAGKGENHIGPMTSKASENKLSAWLPETAFTWHDDIESVLWRKLVVNAAINPLTVYYQCQNGELLNNTKALHHMETLCQELDLLIAKKKLPIVDTFELAKSVCERTAKNYSSMYKDAEAGRQTEIDFINGYIVKECQRHEIPCTAHSALVDYIQNLN